MTDKNKPIIYYRAGFWRVRYAEGMEWHKLSKEGKQWFNAASKYAGQLNYIANQQIST